MSNYQHRRFTGSLSQRMKNNSSELASRRSRHHYHRDRPYHHLSNHDATKECRFLHCARRCVFTGSVVLVPAASVAEDRVNVTDDNEKDGKKEKMCSAISSSNNTVNSASIPSIRIEEGNNMDGGEDGNGDDAVEEKNGDGNSETRDANSNQPTNVSGKKKKEKKIHKKKKKKKNIIAVRTTSILPKCDNSVKVFNDESGTSNPTFPNSPDLSSAAATDHSVKEICVQPLIVLDLNGILCHRVRFRDIPPSILAIVLADNQQQQKQQQIDKETINCNGEKDSKISASSSPPTQSSSTLDHTELNKEITFSEPRTTNSKRKRSDGSEEQQSKPTSSSSQQRYSSMKIDLDATNKDISSSCNNHSSSNKKESYNSRNKRQIIDDERNNLHQITKKIYRQPMGRVSGTDIVARTDIASFLRFLNQHFCLAVWTSAKKKTANYLIDMLFPADVKRCLLFVWGQNRCNVVRTADLEAAVLAGADSTAKQSGDAFGVGASAGGEDHLLATNNSTNGKNLSGGDGNGDHAKDRNLPTATTTERRVDAAEANDGANLNSNVVESAPSPTIHRKGRHRDIVFIKSLSKVWEEYPLWNPSNTLLIDDSPEKCPEKFRKNVVHPPPILGLDAPSLSFLPNVEGMVPIETDNATSKVKSNVVKTETTSRNLSENMNDCSSVGSDENAVLKKTEKDGNHTNNSNIGIRLQLDNENVHNSNHKQNQLYCQEGEVFPPDVFIDEVNQFKQLLFFKKLANVWKKSHSEEQISKTIDNNLTKNCDTNDDDDHVEEMGTAEDGRLEQFLNKFGRGHMGWQCKQ